jgi:hypothetical protein
MSLRSGDMSHRLVDGLDGVVALRQSVRQQFLEFRVKIIRGFQPDTGFNLF